MNGPSPLERFAEAYTSATGWGIDSARVQQDVRCPAHEDGSPSLSVGAGRDGRVLLTCQAGCDRAAVLDVVGLVDADLFPPRDEQTRPQIVASYPYTDEHGTVLFTVHRKEPGRDGSKKDFVQQAADGSWKTRGIRKPLYRLPDVVEAVKNGTTIWVVEGEKDADRLAGHGLVATTCPQGAGKWKPEHTATLDGAADVRIVADDDEPGRKHAAHVEAALRGVVRSVRVLLPAAGKKDVSDHLNAGHGLDDLRPLVDEGQAPAAAPSPAAGESGKGERGPSQASQLVSLARERYELFMSEDGRPYGVKKDGPNIALPLRGRAGLRSQLARIYTDTAGGAVPSASALADAMTVLEGIAQSVDPRVPHLRVARDDDGRIVVDLGASDGRCVIVGPDGWERAGRSPVLFRRSGAMKPLPDPVRDGDGLAKLRGLLNTTEDGFRLLVAWLIAAFIPGIPHPILTFRGEQGTGKSYSAKMVIGIIDPSGAPKRTAPRDIKSWATQAFNSWALCLDNVSIIADWLSDALCRAVTGDGIVDRALYTDDDVVVLEFRRVLAMTTIDAGALNGDLAERLLTIELRLIPDSARREEADLDAAYADAHPAILASLFDLLADVLKVLPDVVLTERPRMADFARVLAAVDRVTGWSTLESYKDTARDAVADVLDGEPFAKAVVELVDRSGPDGLLLTASELLEKVATPDRLPKKWPKDATRAGGQLKRLAPALRTIGIDVDDSQRGPKPKKQRLYRLTASTERRCETASPASPNGENRPLTWENRGDASESLTASPLDPWGDAEDDEGDADPFTASPHDTGSDLHEYGRGDAGTAGDAEMHPLSEQATTGVVLHIAGRTPVDIPPGAAGPCVTCHQTTHRYGPGGNPRCPRCREAS
ncbi:4Fe-4S ferredoxin-type domain-containing protein [Frankia sp. Hr75.2]|nr:4Fe-4S ferredoxin-type domain-containing protein [Frankia sp. Hr75.2]